MKKNNLWTGILAVMLVFTMTAVGCDNDSSDSNNNGGGDTAVTFNSATADGSDTQPTTQLTLAFSKAITGLSVDDIALSGVSGVSKGTLSNSGASYTLPISGFSEGGVLSVAVSKTGYTVSGSPKTVTVYYNSAVTGTYGDFEYTETDSITITRYNGARGNGQMISVTIPAQINGKSVTRIGDEAFSGCGLIQSVSIPNSVTSIGRLAFSECGFHSVTIPSSVTSIEAMAFSSCTWLESVTFQGTITADNFGSNFSPFHGLGDLKEKYLAGGIGTYTRPNGTGTVWTKQN